MSHQVSSGSIKIPLGVTALAASATRPARGSYGRHAPLSMLTLDAVWHGVMVVTCAVLPQTLDMLRGIFTFAWSQRAEVSRCQRQAWESACLFTEVCAIVKYDKPAQQQDAESCEHSAKRPAP